MVSPSVLGPSLGPNSEPRPHQNPSKYAWSRLLGPQEGQVACGLGEERVGDFDLQRKKNSKETKKTKKKQKKYQPPKSKITCKLKKSKKKEIKK